MDFFFFNKIRELGKTDLSKEKFNIWKIVNLICQVLTIGLIYGNSLKTFSNLCMFFGLSVGYFMLNMASTGLRIRIQGHTKVVRSYYGQCQTKPERQGSLATNARKTKRGK